jgi:hypothetical protein
VRGGGSSAYRGGVLDIKGVAEGEFLRGGVWPTGALFVDERLAAFWTSIFFLRVRSRIRKPSRTRKCELQVRIGENIRNIRFLTVALSSDSSPLMISSSARSVIPLLLLVRSSSLSRMASSMDIAVR